MPQKMNKVGEINKSNQGYMMTIIKYYDYHNIEIMFNDERNTVVHADYAEKYGMLKEKNYDIIDYHTYRLGDDTRSGKRYALEKELQKECADKIAQIILDLELGETTKKELNDVLANVNF